jgi:DNA-directed RNA polymerase omega subunit
MRDKVLDGQTVKGSRFRLAMAAAKRSKQLNRMSKERGLPPNQVSASKTKNIKPPTIALVEIMEGKITYSNKHKETRNDLVEEINDLSLVKKN